MASIPPADPVETVLNYHRRTKHHLSRYADGPDGLDWANQPDPFRTFAGAVRIELPLLADALSTTWRDLYVPGATRARRADLTSAAVLFELSLGLSAWKEYRGSRWALRCNPSSGNLHPTEGYLVWPALPGLEAGVYHYDSRDHALQRRCRLGPAGTATLAASMPAGAFLVGLSSVAWREAWKYGTRAFRYCQHDLGHAIAAVRYAAATLGWSVRLLDEASDDEVSAWLGLDRDADFPVAPLDREHPGALLLVGPLPQATNPPPVRPDPGALADGVWTGRANALSRDHVPWRLVDEAARATRKPRTEPMSDFPAALPPLPPGPSLSAATLIRQRRSCLALDGRTGTDLPTFLRLLDHLQPRPGVPPWDVLPWQPQIDLALFVHRVRGLEPGLYLFERAPGQHAERRQAFSPQFTWERAAGTPDHLPLYKLASGDLRALAQRVSCHQDIAADGAFSLGMLASFSEDIRRLGAWWYRRLFWEAGILGQVLYLEAEAAGLRGTGIGCYFDDTMHQALGLSDERWQSLYHFTFGGPVEDERLRTVAPYAHLIGR